MQDFLKIVGPLTKLTKKEEKYAWIEDCIAAFEELKNKLISAPILKMPTKTNFCSNSIEKIRKKAVENLL